MSEKKNRKGATEEVESHPKGWKMLLIARKDLKMSAGKLAAQAAHAAVDAVEKLKNRDKYADLLLRKWDHNGKAKVTLRCDSEEEIDRYHQWCLAKDINCALIVDLGRTQIPCGSKTVLAVGPECSEILDPLFGDLKLY